MTGVAFGQTEREQTSQISKLPPFSQPVDCELALLYIDDALVKAHSSKSNVIFIVKMKNVSSFALARTRANNLRLYLRFRRFTNFQIALAFDTKEAEQVELYVSGERLYSLPIKRNDKLDLGKCVIGTGL
jgi:hypothetical protein